jgi:hypothetical protein
MRIHRIAVPAVLALAVLALGAVPAQARKFETGAELRKALPLPGKEALKGSVEYVGTSDGISIALVRARGGGAVAYLCNGKQTSRWLTGKATSDSATLKGPDSRLKATIDGATARGTARLGERTVRFKLRRAKPGSGLRRYTDRFSGAQLEAAWIVARDKSIRGAGVADKRIVLTTATTLLGAAGDEVTDRRRRRATAALNFFTKARCAVTVIKLSAFGREELGGTLDADDQEAFDEAKERFNDLGCSSDFESPVQI